MFFEIFSFCLFYLIFNTLKQNSHIYSANTYSMHIQFTLMLAAQLLSPFVYVFLPVAIGIIYIICGMRPSEISIQIGLIGIIGYGLSNSLITVGFVSVYRTHFLNVFIFSWLKRLRKIFSSHNVQIAPITGTQ
jgi:hypothetical protein